MQSKLTDATIRTAKPKEKPYKLFDGGGLFLLVTPTKKEELPQGSGGKWWRIKYRFGGKEKLLSFGTYQEVSLASAREKRDAARKQVAAGIDFGAFRKEKKAQRSGENTFETVAREWITLKSPGWSLDYATENGYLGETELEMINSGEGGYHHGSILRHPHKRLAETISRLLPIYIKSPSFLKPLIKQLMRSENVGLALLIYVLSIPIAFPFLGIEGIKVTLRMGWRASVMKKISSQQQR